MPSFEWLEPETIPEAIDACTQYGDEGKLIAGGTWLSLVVKQGLLMPEAVISLHKIDGLSEIRYESGVGLRLGAMTSIRKAEMSPVVQERFPELASTFGEVANVRIRNQATVGGCLADADYASDPPAMLTALNAHVVLKGKEGQRNVSLRDLIVGHYETVIQPDEIMTEIVVPERPDSMSGVYLKYKSRSTEDRPCVGVAATADLNGDGVVRDLSIVIGAVAGTPQYADDVLSLAQDKQLDATLIKQIADGYADSIDPLSDLRGTSWYRQQMISVFVKRALTQLGGAA